MIIMTSSPIDKAEDIHNVVLKNILRTMQHQNHVSILRWKFQVEIMFQTYL